MPLDYTAEPAFSEKGRKFIRMNIIKILLLSRKQYAKQLLFI